MNSTIKRGLIIVALVAGGFGTGYIPSKLNLRSVRESSEKTRRDLEARLVAAEDKGQVASLTGLLGMVLIDVREDNFGRARQRSTAFFDQVRAISTSTKDEALRQRLRSILTRRDEVTAILTTGKPEATSTLQALFRETYAITSSVQGWQ
jgi:hypothetical protein